MMTNLLFGDSTALTAVRGERHGSGLHGRHALLVARRGRGCAAIRPHDS